MRVLVAMSGGVDSSVAAALLADQLGADRVVGATLKLWGGDSDSGCCSVADVDDARRVADELGLVHHVFNFAEAFEARVVEPYVQGHAAGRTPNPCIECNRHVKFDRLLERADDLGFDAVATGHHARRTRTPDGRYRLCRGADPLKDQSYVLAMLGQDQLARVLFPVGDSTKAEVRAEALRRGLRTATKPDSQDVCFIRSDEGRAGFLGDRLPLHPGRKVDHRSGEDLGLVDAVELVTVGQRRGMGHSGDGRRRFVTAVDVPSRRVMLGPPEAAYADRVELDTVTWVDTDPTDGGPEDGGADGTGPDGVGLVAQCSAHGRPVAAEVSRTAGGLVVRFAAAQRRIAPGQTVALYDPQRPDEVVGSGIAQ
jgi:tRNA-uridine 2-sulfurtransferase